MSLVRSLLHMWPGHHEKVAYCHPDRMRVCIIHKDFQAIITYTAAGDVRPEAQPAEGLIYALMPPGRAFSTPKEKLKRTTCMVVR